MRTALLLLAGWLLAASPALAAPEIASASAVSGPGDPYATPHAGPVDLGDGSGPMVITYRNGRVQHVGLDHDEAGKQVYFAQVQISPNRHGVGWLAEYDACAQARPCPLALVVWYAGRPRLRFSPREGVIRAWQFLAGGRQVAVQSGSAQGGGPSQYRLLATATGRSLGYWEDGSAAPRPPWLKFFTRAIAP